MLLLLDPEEAVEAMAVVGAEVINKGVTLKVVVSVEETMAIAVVISTTVVVVESG